MLMAKAIGVLVAYDMYLECVEGGLAPEWKLDTEEIMTLHDFHQELSSQMLNYHPSKRLYPGDAHMRDSTAHPYERRGKRGSPATSIPCLVGAGGEGISTDFEDASDLCDGASVEKDGKITIFQLQNGYKRNKQTQSIARLCGNLESLEKHIHARENRKSSRCCEVCGEKTYYVCSLCDAGLHYFSQKGPGAGNLCYLEFHSEGFYGLAKRDVVLYDNAQKQNWVPASNNMRINQARHIRALRKKGTTTIQITKLKNNLDGGRNH